MKISYYQKFFKQLIKMPHNVQKATLDAVETFQKDRFSNSLNYEKLNTRDKQLRSIRATGKYRIILHETGDVYHVLWIDNHDEAYKWAETKVFEWNKLTQSYQIFDCEVETVIEQVTEQKEQAFMAQFSDEDLLKIGVPERILSDIKRIDNLDALDRLSEYLPEDVFEHIFYLFEGMDIRDIILEVEEGLVQNEIQEQSANNRRNFLQISDKELRQHLEGDFALWKVFLHPLQRKIVEKEYKGPTKITGGAGTGKTVVALHRAKRLLTESSSKKAKPIFFTTYTKSLIRHLKDNLKTLEVDTSRIVLQNLDKFVDEEVKKLGLIKTPINIINYLKPEKAMKPWHEVVERNLFSYSASFLNDEYREVILYHNIKEAKQYYRITRHGRPGRLGKRQRMQVWKLFEDYKTLKKEYNHYDSWELYNLLSDHYNNTAHKPFEHLICDEVQDFSNVELRLMRSLVREKPNDLFLVGDPFQSIYDRKINFSKAGINIRGKRSRKLKVNYRTTEEIKRHAIAVVKGEKFNQFDEDEVDNLDGYVSLIRGKQPSYQVFKNLSLEGEHIVDIIKKHTSDESDVYIAPENICIAARTNKRVDNLISLLYEHNIDVWKISEDRTKKQGIRVSTFHNLKGMEFKVVILTDLSEETFPFLPYAVKTGDDYTKARHIKSEKALLYVAMSRAVQFLYLTGVGEKHLILE